jgi:hypothetical protein
MTSREVIWSWLDLHPGRTAYEIARCALGKRGPTGASVQSGSTLKLLHRMEKSGQVTRQPEYRAQQGREVDLWYAAGLPPAPVEG